jgi:hypothetical protein
MHKKPRSYSERYNEPTVTTRRSFTPTSPRGYKADLDKLFNTGQVPDRFKSIMSDASTATQEGVERQRLIREARQAETPADFHKAVGELVERFELPDDQDLLIRALDHESEKVILAALDSLIEMDGRRPLNKRTILKMRLDTLEQVSSQGAIFDMIGLLRARL